MMFYVVCWEPSTLVLPERGKRGLKEAVYFNADKQAL